MIGDVFRRLLLFGLLAAVAVAVAGAEAQPRVVLDGAGRLVVSRLPQLLTDAEVKRHIDSGLTTSLVFQGGPQGATKSGAARVDIRFELWDEVYLVTVIDGQGRIERSRQTSAAELTKWWSEIAIVLTSPASQGSGSAGQARVSLAVVPFSQAELVDTQRWLTESIGRERAGSPGGRSGGEPDAVSVLIATSMQRRAVRSLLWNVPIERGPIERGPNERGADP